jgi:endonuclease/exonuclease/phosphatase (EEP) superfamily protein YafD
MQEPVPQAARTAPIEPVESSTVPATPAAPERRRSVKILQWNADGINTSLFELRDRLQQHNYDVCVIQEAKLQVTDKIPKISGYATLREDRKHQAGGGLLTFIKTDISYQRLKPTQRRGMEIQPIRIFLGKNQWIDLPTSTFPTPDRKSKCSNRISSKRRHNP